MRADAGCPNRRQVCGHPLAQHLSTVDAIETVQLALKSLGWRGVPADFFRPPTCPQSMHPSLCITCGWIFMLETCNATKTQQRRGFHRGAFGYNESPTSSCHTILLEGASLFGRAFFLVSTPGRSPR